MCHLRLLKSPAGEGEPGLEAQRAHGKDALCTGRCQEDAVIHTGLSCITLVLPE